MLDSTLEFFKKELTDYFIKMGSAKPKIGYPDSTIGDGQSISFPDESMSIMMVNMEQDHSLRQAERYRYEKDGKIFNGFPEIRLNLFLLFVANRKNYVTSMKMLSMVIRYFQNQLVFDRRNVKQLPKGVEKLTVELVTLPFNQQNDIWNGLRTAYLPSLLYKVRMLVYTPEPPLLGDPPIQDIVYETEV